MIVFKPFQAIMPTQTMAQAVSALPYDVVTSVEVKQIVSQHPYSFLRIDRAESNFNEEVKPNNPIVYQKAAQLLEQWIAEGVLIQDEQANFYLIEQTTKTHQQTGVVGLTAISDLIEGNIKDHEKTRADKLQDRITHIEKTQAHTGPIFLLAQDTQGFEQQLEQIKSRATLLFDFVSDDSVRQRGFQVSIADQSIIEQFVHQCDALYIADGHHRATAAKAVALANAKGKTLDPNLDINYFLSVIFLSHQCQIKAYNRVVKDLNGLQPSAMLEMIQDNFEIKQQSNHAITPMYKGEFSMLLDNKWTLLRYRHIEKHLDSPIDLLDVSILQNELLKPILNINDPTTDHRIDFVGGTSGLEQVAARVGDDCKIGFVCVATSMAELIHIASLNQLMPPKSTWFEPKLQSGLFIHRF